jgi:iodotyrosine deiodinase
VKCRIRSAAEEEERRSYEGRMPEEWLHDLAPLGTAWRKPFLETCLWLLAIFAETHRRIPGGVSKHYYVTESVGIAVGILLAALHHAGLATLTHTPSSMGFLREILGRPRNERPFVLIALGYPAERCTVPDLERKRLEEILERA